MKRIALLGEFDPGRETQVATVRAIGHSADALGIVAEAEWVSTVDIGDDLFRRYDGIWVAPGSVYKDQGKLFGAIRFARERGIPCIGTCGGFQHIILEYARNVLGFPDAQSEEYDPNGAHVFISALTCSLQGREMALTFAEGSLVARCYGATEAVERYFCSLGVNPVYAERLRAGGMLISGKDAEGEIRVVEWPGHPFFMGTLFVPQARSRHGEPHPLVSGFLNVL